jgi:hypothetical protein
VNVNITTNGLLAVLPAGALSVGGGPCALWWIAPFRARALSRSWRRAAAK